MGLRVTTYLFKGLTKEEFRQKLQQTAERLEKWFSPSLEDYGDVHVLSLRERDEDVYLLCKAFAEEDKLPWMVLRISEEAVWSYSLFHGSEQVDNFSSLPEYWEGPEDFTPEQWEKYLLDCAGKPELLAHLWQIPQARIEQYVRQWGWVEDPDDEDVIHHKLKGKAYPSDQYEYGECRQMFDFYRVLTGTVKESNLL